MASRLPDNVRVVPAHAIDPHGVAWVRREIEDTWTHGNKGLQVWVRARQIIGRAARNMRTAA